MIEQQSWEPGVQDELAALADDLIEIERALTGRAGDDRSPPPPAEILPKLVAGMAACERLVEDHATGARLAEAETLHTVAITLASIRSLMSALIAAGQLTPPRLHGRGGDI